MDEGGQEHIERADERMRRVLERGEVISFEVRPHYDQEGSTAFVAQGLFNSPKSPKGRMLLSARTDISHTTLVEGGAKRRVKITDTEVAMKAYPRGQFFGITRIEASIWSMGQGVNFVGALRERLEKGETLEEILEDYQEEPAETSGSER